MEVRSAEAAGISLYWPCALAFASSIAHAPVHCDSVVVCDAGIVLSLRVLESWPLSSLARVSFAIIIRMKWIQALLALLILCFPAKAAEDRVFIWTVVPQFSPTIVHRDWIPLLDALQQRTGYRFKLVPSDSFEFFEGGLLLGKFDFAYANPYQTLLAHRAQGYIPLVRDEQRRLTGILVVRKDSPLQRVDELAGQKIALAALNAFAVSLYMRALLTEKEGISFEPLYVGTHSNAYRQVLLGRTAACGGIYRTMNKESAAVRDNLRVIYEIPSTITHAVSAHPSVAVEVRKAVQRALLELSASEQGRRLLRAVFLPQPVAADYDRDYAPLQSLNLDSYVVLPD